MQCPKCGSTNSIKSGTVKQKQRYKCIQCKCQFTRSDKQGSTLRIKMHAVLLFASGVSMNSVAKIFEVAPPTVMRWVNQFKDAFGEDFPKQIKCSRTSNLESISLELDPCRDITVSDIGDALLFITIQKHDK